MFLIKKLICAVAILLVVVLGVSFVSRSFEFGSGGSSFPDGYTGIGLPAEGIQLSSKSSPLNDEIVNLKDSEGFEFSSYFGKILYYEDLDGAGEHFTGYESVTMNFINSSTFGIPLDAYSYFKIEFDVLKTTSAPVLGCSFSLLGRAGGFVAESLSISKSHIRVDVLGGNDSLCVETYNGKLIEGDSFHVVYVLEIDKENLDQSRMQVFINDVLYEDSLYYDGLFTKKDVTDITAISVTGFNTTDKKAEISFENLVVTGYQ